MTVTVLSAFNPHEFSEATVRTVATGREANLKEILAAIRSNLQSQTIQHLILSAPRGYGKSFMMRHIQIEAERIAREEVLQLSVVLMPEELPHVKEPETLIRELTRALSGGAAEEAELSWHEDDGAAWETAAETLNATIRQKVGARGLFIALVENFDLLLRRAFPKEIQASRLRSLLTEQDSRLMLIAASASGAFDRDYDSRLFQAFKEIALEPWSLEDCLIFFDRQRVDAGKPPLDDSAKARAKSVASFIGGTPRLATLLGDALFDEDVLRAADLLQKLVDELTPYYKERIEALPGRSQKLLDALLRGGEPATQSEIARRVNAKSQAAIAGPFNELVRERIVTGEKAAGSAEVLYRVADRVFAHYYRRRIIDHGRAGCPLEALVDLLAEYFSPEEKRTKATEFAQRGRIEEARVMARLHDADRGAGKGTRFWILAGLSQYISTRLIPLASSTTAGQLRAIGSPTIESEINEAYAKIEAAFHSANRLEDRVALLLARLRLDAYEGIDGGLSAADEAITIAEQLSDRRFQLTSKLARVWSLINLRRYNEALELSFLLAEQAKSAGCILDQGTALREAAFALAQLYRYEEALVIAKQAVELSKDASDFGGEALALSHAAFDLANMGRYEEALVTARQAADRHSRAGNMVDEAVAFRCITVSLTNLGRYEESLTAARHGADLAEKGGDVSEEAMLFRCAAFSLAQLERHDEAIANARQAADLAKEAGDTLEEAIARRQAAFSLARLDRDEEAILFAQQAADLARKIGDMREEIIALSHSAYSLSRLRRHEEAVAIARQVVGLANKAGYIDEELEARRLLAWYLCNFGEHIAAIEAIAVAAEALELRSIKDENELMVVTSALVASEAAASLAGNETDLDRLHALLRAAAENLDFDGVRRVYLQSWLAGFVKEAMLSIHEPNRLDAWATAIELNFPKSFGDEISRLRDAARYHESGHDHAFLARLEPDVARTLEMMFPPVNHVPAKEKSKGRKPPKRKR